MSADLHFGCRRQHLSSEGRRELSRTETTWDLGLAERRLILWSGCDADREPIVEIQQTTYWIPGPDENDEGQETKTLGWIEPAEIRELLSALNPADAREGEA